MQMEFLQSEQNSPRRRWILVLVDSSDGVTGKTGQTGTVQISKNGGTPVASTNSLVEVDSTNMPGHYYIELTAGEVDTLGMISIYYKATNTLAFHDRGFVTYDDPFAAGGILVGGGSGSEGGSKLPKDFWEKLRKIVKEEVAEVEIPEVEIPDYTEKLDQILGIISQEEATDWSPVFQAISEIKFPEIKFPLIKDYSDKFDLVLKEISKLPKEVTQVDYKRLEDKISPLLALSDQIDKAQAFLEASDSSILEKVKENDLTTVKDDLENLKQKIVLVLTYLVNQKFDNVDLALEIIKA